MKVTGWTYSENPSYEDIALELTELNIKSFKQQKELPEDAELSKLSPQLMCEIAGKHASQMLPLAKEIESKQLLLEQIVATVVQDINKNNYHFTGEEHLNEAYGAPIIDDKYVLCVSMRTWGGIIADAFPHEIDNSDGFGYVIWAWLGCPQQEGKHKIPDKKLWR